MSFFKKLVRLAPLFIVPFIVLCLNVSAYYYNPAINLIDYFNTSDVTTNSYNTLITGRTETVYLSDYGHNCVGSTFDTAIASNEILESYSSITGGFYFSGVNDFLYANTHNTITGDFVYHVNDGYITTVPSGYLSVSVRLVMNGNTVQTYTRSAAWRLLSDSDFNQDLIASIPSFDLSPWRDCQFDSIHIAFNSYIPSTIYTDRSFFIGFSDNLALFTADTTQAATSSGISDATGGNSYDGADTSVTDSVSASQDSILDSVTSDFSTVLAPLTQVTGQSWFVQLKQSGSALIAWLDSAAYTHPWLKFLLSISLALGLLGFLLNISSRVFKRGG